MNKNKEIKAQGFKHFKLSNELIKGIIRKGYSAPTPIQNKTIPLIICGRNVVAMAPTGSGKTASFLIPMFEKLKNPFCGEFQSGSIGPRALIISPTRELALQTVKFASELGHFMSIKAAVLLGGERMDEDFRALHENPDVIIATPARLLHIQVEMGSKFNLSNVEYVVFDEGDRLFELGMVEQLTETLNRLPKSRQTVIFSATLPANLVEFAKAGLDNPILVRLDLHHRLSDNLQLSFLHCTDENKLPVLIELLQLIKKRNEQAIIFFASKHHIEYVSKILERFSFDHTLVYSSLDPEARRDNANQFIIGDARVMLTTDIAARGIDIPELANVINYHFPDKPKLFQHRVGRVARAGRSGCAFNLVDNVELPYVMDTFMYLSRPFKMLDDSSVGIDEVHKHGYIGAVPSSIITEHMEVIEATAKNDCEVKGLVETSVRAFGKYNRTKKMASSESVKRSRQFISSIDNMQCHPVFEYANQISDIQMKFRIILKRDRPQRTIFETIHGKNEKACDALVNLRKMKERKELLHVKNTIVVENDNFLASNCTSAPVENYKVPNLSGPDASESGLSLQNSGFALEAKEAILELQNDEMGSQVRAAGAKRQRMMWDRKRKRFVGQKTDKNSKKIRTESGAVISASYKTDAYERWLKASNVGMITEKTVSFENDDNDMDGHSNVTEKSKRNERNQSKRTAKTSNGNGRSFKLLNSGYNRYKNHSDNLAARREGQKSRELRPEQVMKKMKEKNKVKDFQKSRQKLHKKHRK